MPFVPYVSKAADRRDRLIYVLSQINTTRMDGAGEVEEESSSEEEEAEAEVRLCLFYAYKRGKFTLRPSGILHRRDCGSTRSEEVNSRVLPA